MPGPEQLIRAAVALPVAVVRRLAGIVGGIVPGLSGDEAPGDGQPAPGDDVEIRVAADDALTRKREPVEESAPPVATTGAHVEPEHELVAESADVGATEPPGPEFHVDEPWDGYRRMKVAEIRARLDGQPPEVLAAVEMYETTHRKRRGVLQAVRSASRA